MTQETEYKKMKNIENKRHKYNDKTAKQAYKQLYQSLH